MRTLSIHPRHDRRTDLPPPPRPRPLGERAAAYMLSTFGMPVTRAEAPDPPHALTPFQRVTIPRPGRRGTLAGTWYETPGEARGAVLLVHPWLPQGQSYFHLRRRIQALRAAGYHALTFDLGGFGASGPRDGLYDRDVEDALAALGELAPGLPLHLWGVSAGANLAHMLLSRRNGVEGAFFEQCPTHLIEFSHRVAPHGRPFYAVFRRFIPGAYRYLEARRHAPFLQARQIAYVGGERDEGVRPEAIEELADLAGGRCLIVPDAAHLDAIKRAPHAVVDLALETFERAEGG